MLERYVTLEKVMICREREREREREKEREREREIRNFGILGF